MCPSRGGSRSMVVTACCKTQFFGVFRKKGHHHPKYYHGSTLKLRLFEKRGTHPPSIPLGIYSAEEITRKSIYHPLNLDESGKAVKSVSFSLFNPVLNAYFSSITEKEKQSTNNIQI